MRKRKVIISEKDKRELIDLFELSPMKVIDIAKAYGLARSTLYRLVSQQEVLNGSV